MSTSPVSNPVSTALVAAVALASCVLLQACSEPRLQTATQVRHDLDASPTALPLAIPLGAVMAGPINRASNRVFRQSTRTGKLSEAEWTQMAVDAVDLVGLASLITLPGTGSEDLGWTRSPEWRAFSADMQAAGLALGSAATHQDERALTVAVAQLAQSCQSCHMAFSPRLVTSPP